MITAKDERVQSLGEDIVTLVEMGEYLKEQFNKNCRSESQADRLEAIAAAASFAQVAKAAYELSITPESLEVDRLVDDATARFSSAPGPTPN